MTKERIMEIVNAYVNDARIIFGAKLKSVILFGSCARGDYDDESDIILFLSLFKKITALFKIKILLFLEKCH